MGLGLSQYYCARIYTIVAIKLLTPKLLIYLLFTKFFHIAVGCMGLLSYQLKLTTARRKMGTAQ